MDVPNEEVGLGVDIVEIARMRKIIDRSPAFVEKVYSAAERAYCDSHAHPEVHYATRFAAKEAVLKALGTGFSEGIGWLDVEVRRTSKGRPYVVLTGRAREVAREQGVREIPLSLSYTHTDAVACAMAITEESVAATERRRDPMEELTRQFKDARALLDDLPGAPAAGENPRVSRKARHPLRTAPRAPPRPTSTYPRISAPVAFSTFDTSLPWARSTSSLVSVRSGARYTRL